MSEMLLINPAKRRKRNASARPSAAARRRYGAQAPAGSDPFLMGGYPDEAPAKPRRKKRKAATRKKSAARRTTRRTRKAPVMARRRRRTTTARRRRSVAAYRPRRRTSYKARARLRALSAARRAISRARRMNPRRRRMNPIISTSGIMGSIQQALMQGAGAVAFDVVHAQLARFMPASFQPVPGQVGLGDAVKAVTTVLIGRALRGPTRGMSMRAAQGALTVQAHQIIRSFVPAGMGLSGGLGYNSAAQIANMSNRIGPNRAIRSLNEYTGPGGSPLLSAYTKPGATPLLNGSRNARIREGVTTLR